MNPQTFWVNNKKHIQCVVLGYIHTQEDSWVTPSCHIPRFFIPRDQVSELTHSIEKFYFKDYNPPNCFGIITLDYILFLLVSHPFGKCSMMLINKLLWKFAFQSKNQESVLDFKFLCLLTLIIHDPWIMRVKRQSHLSFNLNFILTCDIHIPVSILSGTTEQKPF